jgi:hypothetical protein
LEFRDALGERAEDVEQAAAERVRNLDSSRLPSFPPALLFVAGLIRSSSIALALRARRRNR